VSAREPLAPDERALAGRLREWSVAEPSTALDQRILAQARAAVPAPARRPRPLLFGLASAATVVLAVGVVWRVLEAPPAGLPPVPDAAPQMRAAGEDAAARSGSIPGPTAPQAPLGDVEAPAPPLQASQEAATRPAAGGRDNALSAPPPADRVPPPAAPAPRPATPPVAAAPPAAPPAPPAPPVPAPAEAEAARAPAVSAAPAAADREQGRALEVRRERGALGAEPAADAIEGIRALIAAGQLDEARNAIARLRERWPALVLPADLQTVAADPER
jgi:hypothetical protein